MDGFNFYYGLKHKIGKKYYWLDMVSFCEKIYPFTSGSCRSLLLYCNSINKGKQDGRIYFFLRIKLNPNSVCF